MNTSSPPRYSIVIPTYQRPEGLRNCLTAIAAMPNLKGEIEVIVVDDGSTSDTGDVMEPFKADLNLALIRQENQGPASARNAGARLSRGKYLLFIDDDCVPGLKWLEYIQSNLHEEQRLAVGGRCRNDLVESIYSAAQQMLLDYLHNYYNRDPDHVRFCLTNNLAIPREPFLDLGGFDTTFRYAGGEDRDFCARWIESGGRFIFTANAPPVRHRHHMGFWDFMRMHVHYGRGARQFHVKGAANGKRRGFESAPFYIGLVTFPYAHTGPARATMLCGLQILSQLAHACGYLAESLVARGVTRRTV